MPLEFTKVSDSSGGKYRVTLGSVTRTVGTRQKAILEYLERKPNTTLRVVEIAEQFPEVSYDRIMHALITLSMKFKANISCKEEKVVYTP